MTPKDFVECFFQEKQSMLADYLRTPPTTTVGQKIASLEVGSSQKARLAEILDDVLTDAFYTVLLGLDGEARIGGTQQPFKLYDEGGTLLTDGGEIEAAAWERFHGGRR